MNISELTKIEFLPLLDSRVKKKNPDYVSLQMDSCFKLVVDTDEPAVSWVSLIRPCQAVMVSGEIPEMFVAASGSVYIKLSSALMGPFQPFYDDGILAFEDDKEICFDCPMVEGEDPWKMFSIVDEASGEIIPRGVCVTLVDPELEDTDFSGLDMIADDASPIETVSQIVNEYIASQD